MEAMETLSDRIRAEILGIRNFNALEDNNCQYELIHITEWTEEICKELNNVDFLKKYCFANDDKFKDKDLENDKLNNILKNFENLQKREGGKYEIRKVYIYEDLKIDFVRFNHMLILRSNKDNIEEFNPGNEKSIYSKIESSIIENLGIVAGFDIIKRNLLEKTETPSCCDFDKDQYFKNLEQLKNICAVSAMFSINKRPMNGADNYIWYELLQNANDHIPNDAGEKTLEIKFNDAESTFSLSYPDKGFSVRDFLAICTEGNSGNVLSDENREGRKGTGFKSVYNLFDKVTILSGPVKCELEDVDRGISIDENGNVSIDKKENEKKEKEYYYPIPSFSESKSEEKKTTITLHTSQDLSEIKKYIFGEDFKECEPKILLEKFQRKEDYLFLDNIQKIKFIFIYNQEKKEITFEKNKYIGENYIRIEYNYNAETVCKRNNPNWVDRSDDLFSKKMKTIFLFPKDVELSDDKYESRVYCTLPIEEFKLKMPFYVNIPLLELKDDRKSIADGSTDTFDIKTWNQSVLVEGLVNAFTNIVENKTQQNIVENKTQQNIIENDTQQNIGISNWYRYFPYEYLNSTNKVVEIDWSGELKEIKFLRATTSTNNEDENVKAVAINDIVQNDNDIQEPNKAIFLPCKMYDWIHKNIEDEFKNHSSGDGGKIPPVFFIFYDYVFADDSKNKVIEEMIKTKIGITDDKAVLYLQEQEKQVGKILLELKNYLINDYKKNLSETEKKDFYDWLKELLKSTFFNFAYKNTFIYQAFFNANDVDYKNGKYHWLESNEGAYLDEKVGNYSPICEVIKNLKKCLYESEDHHFQNEEEYGIKCCFTDLIESPYIKYTYEKNGGTWKVSEELRIKSNSDILPLQNTNKYLSDEILCNYSEKLLKSDLTIGTVYGDNGWYKENKVLIYVKNTNGIIIPASEKVYYSSKKDVKSDFVVAYGENFFIGLEKSLSKDEDFFYQNQDNEEFVKQVLERYDLSIWKDQAIKYISEAKEGIRATIFRYIISKSVDPVEWNGTYSDLIKELTQDELWGNGKIVFNITKKTNICSLPQYILDVFENKVSVYEKEKRVSEASDSLQLQEIVKKKVYILPCQIGNKARYCKARIFDSSEAYILFSDGSFGTFLRRVFECSDFNENRIFSEMLCNDIDMISDVKEQESEEFLSVINTKVDDLIKKWMSGEKDYLKNALVGRFDVRNKETKKWFHARGYGNVDYKEKRCPICEGILLSEMDALRMRNITCVINEHKYYFPMFMCKNCSEAINYADSVKLEIIGDDEGKNDIFKVAKNLFVEFNITYFMVGREQKSFSCDISFLNRYIWKRIKENDDASRNDRKNR